MPRSHSERLELLKSTRDCLDDALAASAADATVVSYTTQDGRSTTRSRIQVIEELNALEKKIAKLELNVNGPAANYASKRRQF